MNQLSILYVLPSYDSNTDTHFSHLYDLLSRLSARFRIHLLVERGTVPANGQWASAKVLPSTGPLLRTRRLLASIIYIKSVRINGCRLLYTHYSFYSGIFGTIIFRLSGGKSLYWSCALMNQFRRPWSINPQALFRKISNELPLWLTLKLVNSLVTGSNTVARHYAEYYPIKANRIEIVPNWVDLSRFNPQLFDCKVIREQYKIPISANVVLFVHRIAKRKGSDRIVSIAKQVIQTCADTIFLVAGSGPDEQSLKLQVKESGLEEHIRLVGSVANTLVPALFAAADVFIMPSREEGFPRVLIESMAMGVPFVAVRVGGVEDITTPLQKLFLVDPFDTKQFSAKVTNILRDKTQVISLCQEGIRQVQQYSLETAVENFTNLWNKHLN